MTEIKSLWTLNSTFQLEKERSGETEGNRSTEITESKEQREKRIKVKKASEM